MSRRAHLSLDQLGAPVAYRALKDGTPVYDSNGERVGVVEHVLTDSDIFEGVIVHTYPLPGRHLYADVTQIDEIRENGLLLSVGRGDLHDPRTESHRSRSDGRAGSYEARRRHALDWLRGTA